ncbi:Ribosomal protein S12 methylthiotransferase accessory factor YcaO, partial [Bienertia sinuspersici]
IFHGEGHSLEGTDQEMSEDKGDDFEDEDPVVTDDLASLVHKATNNIQTIELCGLEASPIICSYKLSRISVVENDIRDDEHDDEKDFEMHNLVMGDEEDGEILPRYDVPMEIVSDEDIKDDHNVEEDEELDESPFRGPSRALKYKKLRQMQPGKVNVNIPSSLGAAVGDHALQFIWVKEICPLNVEKWSDMPEDAKFSVGEGSHIDKALKIQCSMQIFQGVDIYQWKWLVYNYWNSHKMRQISEKNQANALSKKIQSACGAKSIARILYEMEVEVEASFEVDNEGDSEGNASNSTAPQQTQADAEPIYVKLHKDGSFDDEGEVKLNELKKVYEKEIQEKGIDSLSIDKAYMKVLGHCSGYAHGLGKGHPVFAKDGRKGKQNWKLRSNNLERKEKETREKEEALEKKLELIRNTLGL